MIHEYEYKMLVRTLETSKDTISSMIQDALCDSPHIELVSITSTKIDNYYEIPNTWVHLFSVEDPEEISSVEMIQWDKQDWCSFLVKRTDDFIDEVRKRTREGEYNLMRISRYRIGYDEELYFGLIDVDICLQKILEFYELI